MLQFQAALAVQFSFSAAHLKSAAVISSFCVCVLGMLIFALRANMLLAVNLRLTLDQLLFEWYSNGVIKGQSWPQNFLATWEFLKKFTSDFSPQHYCLFNGLNLKCFQSAAAAVTRVSTCCLHWAAALWIESYCWPWGKKKKKCCPLNVRQFQNEHPQCV